MGVIGSIFSGIFGASSSNKAATVEANASTHAADLTKQAADQSLAFQKQQYANSLNLMAPWLNSGTAANSKLSFLMGLNPSQGLPPGVVNPNAPSATNTGAGGNIQDIINSIRSQNGVGGPNGIPRPMQANSAMLQAGQNPFGPTSGTQSFNMNPPITSPGTQSNTVTNPGNGLTDTLRTPGAGANFNPFSPGGGAAGMLNPDGTTTTDFNPGPQTLSVNPNSATNASGAPGTLARTDGVGAVPGDQGGTGNTGGGFGSLAQGWGQTFSSPTNVTEQNDPGYQFRLQQGQKALEASAAARGGLLTGGTSKAINDYAQNSASNEYGNVYNRALQNYQTNYNTFTNDQTNLYNRLASMSGQGQVSANQLSGAGQGFANSAGNLLMGSAGQQGVDLQNAAQARGSGYINQANAYGNMFNNLSGAASLFQLLGGGA